MKFNFKKISAIASSVLLTGMTLGVAAAASFPAPFKAAGVDGTAVVYGLGADPMDATQANSIANYLSSQMPSTGTPTGDSVLLAKSSDNLNVGDAWTVFSGTVDDADLSTLLADGTYIADDNDEFKYEQSITLGAPTLTHFRDSDYEDLVGSATKTPVLGFKISSNVAVMNYTLDFIQDAESDIVSGDLDDIEGSDITLMGKTYYVSDFKNGTSSTYLGKLTLLDAANTAIVSEGETTTVNVAGKSYVVSIASLTTSQVKFIVNGETTNSLSSGSSFRLADNSYIGVKDLFQRDVSGVTGNAEFSIGSGKLEIESGSDIKLNDDTIQGVKGYIARSTGTSGSEKVNSIIIEWKTDEEMFLTPESELVMPGFGAVKFTMNDLIRPTEEKVTIENDGDTSIGLTVPIKDGDASFNILYGTSTGNFTGIGKASDERLATTNTSTLLFTEKSSGTDYDKWFVASYATTSEAESYLLKATVQYNSGTNRNETDIINVVTGETLCDDYYLGKACKIGDVSLTIGAIAYTSGGNETVSLTAGTGVSFNTIYTDGGLKIYLPYLATNNSVTQGAINFSLVAGDNLAGHSDDTFYLFMDGENKEDTIAGGTEFNFTIDNDGTTTNALQVSQVNNAGTGGASGLEVGTGSGNYEAYIVDDVAPRVIHYTKGDPDYAEVYYPTGDSETYAQVYLTEASASSSTTSAGSMVFTDSEKTSWSNKNVVLVGGNCVNSATAEVLGVSMSDCLNAFTAKTGAGTGQYVIQSVADKFATGKIAVVVAGYTKEDTAAAASRLILPGSNIDTSTGKNYLGVVGATGSSTISAVN